MVERRYAALRTIAGVHKFAAWACWIFSVLAFFVSLAGGSAGFVVGLGVLLGGFVLGLVLMAIGESILVVIDIEENTRRVASKLDPLVEMEGTPTRPPETVPPGDGGTQQQPEPPHDPTQPRLVAGRNGRRYFLMPNGKCHPVRPDGTPDLAAMVVPGRDEPGWRESR